MLPFVPRLICLCLAALFLVNLVSGSVLCLLAPWLVRIAESSRAQTGASLLIRFGSCRPRSRC